MAMFRVAQRRRQTGGERKDGGKINGVHVVLCKKNDARAA